MVDIRSSWGVADEFSCRPFWQAGTRRSLLGDSGLAQAFENALGPCQVRRCRSSPSRRRGREKRQNRVELEAGLDCGTGLADSTKLRKGDGQVKIRMRIISIGLDRPSKRRDSFLPGAEVVLRNARETLPGMGISIARTEAQGFAKWASVSSARPMKVLPSPIKA